MKDSLNKQIIIAIPCLLRGGTEMQTLLLSRALIESGYDVEVCCYFERDESVVAEFRAVGAKVQLLGWNRAIATLTFIRELSKIFREKSPDMVHVQYMAPGLLPIIAARLARIPVILATVHQPGTPHGLKNRLLLRFGARLVNCFTCVSEAAEKSWFGNSFLLDPEKPADMSGRRHLTIPNAVDISALEKALSTESSIFKEIESKLKGKVIIGAVSRLSREKGIDILVEAFERVKKAIPDAHLLIVGDGVELTAIKELASKLAISDSLTLTGKLSWDNAMKCMSLMDIVAVPSRFEGFGLSAIEAMACGKPVLACSVGGLPEIINDGVNGILVPPENVNALADSLKELSNNRGKRKAMGDSVRKYVGRHYDYSAFKNKFKFLYSIYAGK